MITRIKDPVLLLDGKEVLPAAAPEAIDRLARQGLTEQSAKQGTMAYRILAGHNRTKEPDKLQIRFDALASHDITYVGVIQTARASGLVEFPLPYVLTNCHNSLCAVGGTINEDDHLFGLSAAKKYGGVYVPAHGAVIHQYMREAYAACGSMILGSDSHTRYGALGTLGIGEGGPELVKQLLGKTYDIPRPEVVAVVLKGAPRPGVGPQDVALALIGATFPDGFLKNAVLEFVGEGLSNLSMDFRMGIDVMTTETTCLSSIWLTDGKTKDYFERHCRPEAYQQLAPENLALYERAVIIDLSQIQPMIALPFHPSNVYSIEELRENAADILRETEQRAAAQNIKFSLTDKLADGQLQVAQGIIAGCAGGGFENICAAADILKDRGVGDGVFQCSVYPASQPIYAELVKNGALSALIASGAIIKTAFCGPCFGAGDVPANNSLSIRHATRNFPNREGSKPNEGQIAAVALMDARSIAATAANQGVLTPATDLDIQYTSPEYRYDDSYYKVRVYQGFGKAEPEQELQFGPNIADWPAFSPLPESLLLCVASVIDDPVTTTDELIPSGETSSYRSNPERLSEFTLSRKDPEYVARAKAVRGMETLRRREAAILYDEMEEIFAALAITDVELEWMIGSAGSNPATTAIGSVIFAKKPGDGSAREQAASCQKVLGGWANIANEYATKRYRSNLINWGMLPLLTDLDADAFAIGDWLLLPDIREHIANGEEEFPAIRIRGWKKQEITLKLGSLTIEERQIILDGCLINHYRPAGDVYLTRDVYINRLADIGNKVEQMPFIDLAAATQSFFDGGKSMVKLYVSLRENNPGKQKCKQEIFAFCKANFPYFLQSSQIIILDMPPKTEISKIDFMKLTEELPKAQ